MTHEAPVDDRLHILLDQLDAAWEMLDARLSERRPWADKPAESRSTLTDDEYFWEPVPGCWSIRRREEAHSPRVFGRGEWVMEEGDRSSNPPAVTTIAWRLCHLAMWQSMRYDYTFGGHSLTLDDTIWPSTADDAVTFLRLSHTQWRQAVAGMSTDDLDTIGRSQMPHGLDPTVRFVDLLAWTNVEFAHHAAELGCLRDLYRAGLGSAA